MKKLLFLSFLLISTLSCSSDETDENISDNPSSNDETFLEKYDGYGFIRDFDDYKQGLYFSNSDQFLKIFNQYVDTTECVSFNEGTSNFDGDEANVTIVTNNQLSLLIEFLYNDGSGDREMLECTVDSTGNTLTLKFVDTDTSVNYEIYAKTSLEYSSFCN